MATTARPPTTSTRDNASRKAHKHAGAGLAQLCAPPSAPGSGRDGRLPSRRSQGQKRAAEWRRLPGHAPRAAGVPPQGPHPLAERCIHLGRQTDRPCSVPPYNANFQGSSRTPTPWWSSLR